MLEVPCELLLGNMVSPVAQLQQQIVSFHDPNAIAIMNSDTSGVEFSENQQQPIRLSYEQQPDILGGVGGQLKAGFSSLHQTLGACDSAHQKTYPQSVKLGVHHTDMKHQLNGHVDGANKSSILVKNSPNLIAHKDNPFQFSDHSSNATNPTIKGGLAVGVTTINNSGKRRQTSQQPDIKQQPSVPENFDPSIAFETSSDLFSRASDNEAFGPHSVCDSLQQTSSQATLDTANALNSRIGPTNGPQILCKVCGDKAR